MQAVMERPVYQAIELGGTIGTSCALKQEHQVTELAMKIFPEIASKLSERIHQCQADHVSYMLEETHLKNTLKYKVLQNSTGLHVIEGMAGSMLAVLWNIAAFALHPPYAGVGVPINILAGILVGDGLGRLSSVTLRKPIQENLDSLKKKMELARSSKECTEKIIHFTNQLAEFLKDWEKFQVEPDNLKLAKAFITVDALLKANREMLLLASMNKLDVDVAFNDFIQEIQNCIPFDAIKLYLMEEACSLLKEGTIITEWERLKNAPYANVLKETVEQPPNLKSPEEESYMYFFKHQKEFKGVLIAQKIKDIFLDNAKKFTDN